MLFDFTAHLPPGQGRRTHTGLALGLLLLPPSKLCPSPGAAWSTGVWELQVPAPTPVTPWLRGCTQGQSQPWEYRPGEEGWWAQAVAAPRCHSTVQKECGPAGPSHREGCGLKKWSPLKWGLEQAVQV